MQNKYIVRLSDEERSALQDVMKKLKGTSQKVKRAQILLKAGSLHRIPDFDIPLDMRQNAKVCRFFRLVREELEIQRPAVKVIELYEEILRYTDPETGITRMVSACAPPAVLAGCFAGPQRL